MPRQCKTMLHYCQFGPLESKINAVSLSLVSSRGVGALACCPLLLKGRLKLYTSEMQVELACLNCMCLWLWSSCLLQISFRPSLPTRCTLLSRTSTAHSAPRVHLLLVVCSSHRHTCPAEPPPPHKAADAHAPSCAAANTSAPPSASTTCAYSNAAAPECEGRVWPRPGIHAHPEHPTEVPLHPQSLQTLFVPHDRITDQLHEGGEPPACSTSKAAQPRSVQHGFHSG